MRCRLLVLASIAVAVMVFGGGAAPVWAANGDGPARTAAELASQPVCDLVGGPLPGKDAWAFGAPPGVPLEGWTATFTDADGVSHGGALESRPGAAELDGRRVAWLVTPAGWRFTGVSAEIDVAAPTPASVAPARPADDETGAPVLVGACAALVLVPAKADARPTTPAPFAAPDRVGRDAAATLPATGQDIGSMFVVGWALVVTGALLLIVRRRRRVPRRIPSPDEPGLIWIHPPSR